MAFTKQEGIKIQNEQIAYWLKSIKDKKKKREFIRQTNILKKSNSSAKDGYQIKRGTDIEGIFYKVNLGYSDKDYSDHVMSFD